MKKPLFLALAVAFLGAASAFATTFSDADYFGTLDANGHPSGLLLDAAGTTHVDTSFNFISADGTAGFTIGAPYDPAQQGTYTSQLGYVPGTTIDPSTLFFTFFFRDPNGGNETERINIGFGDLVFNGGKFSGSLVTNFGGNATLVGDIQSNGYVMYRIRATKGDFYIDGAYAHFNTPDGGTAVALLGIALLVLAGFGKRLAYQR